MFPEMNTIWDRRKQRRKHCLQILLRWRTALNRRRCSLKTLPKMMTVRNRRMRQRRLHQKIFPEMNTFPKEKTRKKRTSHYQMRKVWRKSIQRISLSLIRSMGFPCWQMGRKNFLTVSCTITLSGRGSLPHRQKAFPSMRLRESMKSALHPLRHRCQNIQPVFSLK